MHVKTSDESNIELMTSGLRYASWVFDDDDDMIWHGR